MADVFISYKKEDAGRVIRLVEALRAEGFSVWWDHGIRAGTEWDRTIRDELEAARIVIAVWSRASVDAPWVKEEAGVGKARGKLVPVKIDDIDPPLGFTLIQAADLVGWSGNRDDARWSFFLDALRATLRGEALAGLERPLRIEPKPARRPLFPLLAGAAVVAALIAGVGAFLLMGSQRAAAPPPPAPQVATPPAPPVPEPVKISAGEQQLWDQAMTEKRRPGFQSYLLAYPNGAYAQRARDILLTCRTETHESWKPGPAVANQMIRGVGNTGGGRSTAQACESAKSEVHGRAKLMCETIVTNGGFRNARWTVADRDCDCERTSPAVTVCIADLAYSCVWEQKMTERIEICG